jgi:hypothetical protein
MDEIRIGKWSELHERLFADSWQAAHGAVPVDSWRCASPRRSESVTTSMGRSGWSTTVTRMSRRRRWRVVIPAELKSEIRDKLDQANITERVLFPGLDGLSRCVARHYAPRR